MKKQWFLALTMACIAVLSSCKKENDSPKMPDPTQYKSSPAYFFQGTVNGSQVMLQDGKNNYFLNSWGGYYSSYLFHQDVFLDNWNNLPCYGYVILEKFSSLPSTTSLRNMLATGSHPYVSETAGIDGVYVWYNENGVQWRSDYGTKDQTGSTFKIVETIPWPGVDPTGSGQNHFISAAEFSCKLYDGNGNSKTLTNCVLRGPSCYY